MKIIIEKIKSTLGNIQDFSYINTSISYDIHHPEFLEELCKSAYVSYLINDEELCNKILEILIPIPFDGNYDKWTWIEFAIILAMYRALLKNDMFTFNKLKERIYQQFNDTNIPESRRRISLKAFKRRVEGYSLEKSREKVNNVQSYNDSQLELNILLSYYRYIVFIYTLNDNDLQSAVVEELKETYHKILNIISKIDNTKSISININTLPISK